MLTIELRLRPLTDPNVVNRFSGHITIRNPVTGDLITSKLFDIDDPATLPKLGLRSELVKLLNAELTAAGIAVS